MKRIVLKNLPCFSEVERLERLNDLVNHKTSLMPQDIAIATGCTLIEGMEILLILYDTYSAEAYLAVYHQSHTESSFILARPITEGFPKLPFTCELCNEEITSLKSLSFDFVFKLGSEVIFEMEEHESQ